MMMLLMLTLLFVGDLVSWPATASSIIIFLLHLHWSGEWLPSNSLNHPLERGTDDPLRSRSRGRRIQCVRGGALHSGDNGDEEADYDDDVVMMLMVVIVSRYIF